jgi:hypothetical protein
LRSSGSQDAPADAINIALDFGIVDKLEILFGFPAKFSTNPGFFVFAGWTNGGKRWEIGTIK